MQYFTWYVGNNITKMHVYRVLENIHVHIHVVAVAGVNLGGAAPQVDTYIQGNTYE